MFNASFKERFIRDAAGSLYRENLMRNLFAFTEFYETANGIDLYAFTDEMFSELILRMPDKRDSIDRKLSCIRAYLEYAHKSGVRYDGDIPDVLRNGDPASLRGVYFANDLHLQIVLDTYYQPESASSFDNLYRLVFWFAFAGIQECDLYRIRAQDVDELTRRVLLDGHEYRLARPSAACLRNCIHMDAFFDVRDTNGGGAPRRFRRSDCDAVLRGSRNGGDISSLRAAISRRNRAALAENPELHQLTYRNVWISGLFLRMAQRQMARLPVDFADAAIADVKNRANVVSGADLYRRAERTAKRLQMEYERWKDAFRPS